MDVSVQGMDQTMFLGGFYIDDSGVELTKEQIQTSYIQGGRNVTAIITPQVQSAVREHFACDNMIGAEIEDDGGAGTSGSHWEQRLFEGTFFHPHCRCSVVLRADVVISDVL